MLSAVATARTETVVGEVGPTTALNEGFQAGLLVAATLALIAAVLTAVISRRARPGSQAIPVDTSVSTATGPA